MSDPQAPQFSLEPLDPSPAKQVMDPWAAQTELATQFMVRGDEKSDLSTPVDQTIGKAVGADQWELFVSCAPADALAQQFDIRLPTFMALHSMGKVSSLSFLSDVAAHLGVAVQKLVIRRQGFGTTLATLSFAEAPGANGQPIRIYACQAQAEPAAAHELTRLLLSRCKVSAVLLDGLSPGGWAAQVEALDAQLPAALRPGSAMLLQPLLPTTELEPLRLSLSMRVGPSLRSVPDVGQPLQAWLALASVWNELLIASHPGTPSESLATLASKPVPPRPPTAGSAASPTPSPRAAPWRSACLALVERYGVQACCVFNARTLSILAHAGPAHPEPSLMARQGRTLLAAMASSGQLLGLGKTVQEAQITLQDRVMLVWQMPVDASVDPSDVLWVMWMPLNLQGSWPAIKVALARSLTKA
jgi:hypothetical protein